MSVRTVGVCVHCVQCRRMFGAATVTRVIMHTAQSAHVHELLPSMSVSRSRARARMQVRVCLCVETQYVFAINRHSVHTSIQRSGVAATKFRFRSF